MQEGDYTFQLTVTDSSGQQDTSQVTVIVQPGKLVASAGNFLADGSLSLLSLSLCLLTLFSYALLFSPLTLPRRLYRSKHMK